MLLIAVGRYFVPEGGKVHNLQERKEKKHKREDEE